MRMLLIAFAKFAVSFTTVAARRDCRGALGFAKPSR